MDGVVDDFEGWLLVVVIHSTVAVQDGHTLLFSGFTVAPVHAVVGSVVPLTGKDEQTLCTKRTHK